MMRARSVSPGPVTVAALLLLWPAAPALAYVDPATTGLAVQILAPVLIAVTTFWRRIKDAAAAVIARVRGAGSSDR